MQKILVVTVIFIDKNNKILMEKHRTNQTMQNLWQFPGGKVESNELLKSAARREVKEELNINISSSSLAPLTFENYQSNNKHFIIFYFICRNWKGVITNKEDQTLRWFGLNEIKTSEIIPYNHKALQQLFEFLEK